MKVPDDVIAELERVQAAERRALSYARNDGGTARALLEYHGHNLLAVTGSDVWAYWTGEKWRIARSRKMTTAFEQAVSFPLQRAAEQSPDDKGLASWANTVSNTGRMVAGMEHAHNLAQTAEFGQEIDEQAFDHYPEAIGVVNGILDLSGPEPVLWPRSAEWRVTRSTKCEFDPDATHWSLDRFLDRFLPEPDLREFVQRLMGYAALRDGNPERLMAWLLGETSTGKSTLAEWAREALGEQYAMATDPSIFREKREAGATSELARALDRRLLTLSEFASGTRVHASIVKRLTGDEGIQARRAHSPDPVERVPAFTPLVVTNKVPHVDEPDTAFQNRLIVVPFNHQADPDAPNQRRTTDAETWPAVLAWLVRGYLAYKQVGLGPATWPEAVRAATRQTFLDLNPAEQFWAERVVVDAEERITTNELLEAFAQWQNDEGVPAEVRLNDAKFRRFVREQKERTPTKPRKLTTASGKRSSVRYYEGLRLR